MSQVYKIMTVIFILSVLFNLAGLPTGIGLLANSIGFDLASGDYDIKLSPLYLLIVAAIGLAVAGTIVASLFARTSPIPFLLGASTLLMISFVTDVSFIMTYAFSNYSEWIAWIISLILAPLSLIYILAVVGWWRGTG